MLKSLLTRGFLPRELPPLFTSKSLDVLAGTAGLPAELSGNKVPWTQPIAHNFARPGGLRRRLSIPNPGSFYRLAVVFQSGAAALTAEWNKSPFTQTKPNAAHKGPRAIVPEPVDRAIARAKVRVRARYLLQADISQFYPSIYTHSVPWALHTKAIAKKSMKDLSLIGNVIDRELQGCQFGQTKGIAIGPDTSLGIAEALLGSVDHQLSSQCRVVGGVRFIDDIELAFETLSDAETALATLEALLNELELQLNATKTKIIELPGEFESTYVTELRGNTPSAGLAPPSQWIDYFNRAFALSRDHRTDGVLRYAVAALQGVTATPRAWPLVQALLWQCIALDPGSLRFVVDVLLLHKHRVGLPIDVSIGTTAINALIQSSAKVGHGSEVLWSIWAAMVLGLKVSAEAQSSISRIDDALVATASLVARERNTFDAGFASPLWSSWFAESCFDQEHWLFVYEALRNKWMPAEVASSKIADAPVPKLLLGAGVTFIDNKAIDTYVPSKLLASGGGGGGGGY